MIKKEKEYVARLSKRWLRVPEGQRKGLANKACRTAIDDLSAWKAVYALSIELRNFEINQLVQRNNFFMIFQGVLFAGVCQSAGMIPVVSFVICAMGLSVACLQAGMASGAKYWQEHWELNSRMSENAMVKLLQRHRIYRKLIDSLGIEVDEDLVHQLLGRQTLIKLFQENSTSNAIRNSMKEIRPTASLANWLVIKRFSVSRIPIYVGLVLALGWAMLLICTFRIDGLSFMVWSSITGFPVR